MQELIYNWVSNHSKEQRTSCGQGTCAQLWPGLNSNENPAERQPAPLRQAFFRHIPSKQWGCSCRAAQRRAWRVHSMEAKLHMLAVNRRSVSQQILTSLLCLPAPHLTQGSTPGRNIRREPPPTQSRPWTHAPAGCHGSLVAPRCALVLQPRQTAASLLQGRRPREPVPDPPGPSRAPTG